jgi:tetratricopeptide (TPR) repeat protein
VTRVGLRLALAATAALALAAGAGEEQTSVLARELEHAVAGYDAQAAEVVLGRTRGAAAAGEADVELRLLRVRAGLAVAELLRIEFERMPAGERTARTTFGQRIDAVAGEALGLLPELPESSERFRMEADLVATMIRSDFRAKKLRGRLDEATERALALDSGNARAWVTAAKPFVFAAPEHGGDPEEALRRLDRALALEPGLEAALLLRALVHEQRGDPARAAADWRVALAANPRCEPARRALAGG